MTVKLLNVHHHPRDQSHIVFLSVRTHTGFSLRCLSATIQPADSIHLDPSILFYAAFSTSAYVSCYCVFRQVTNNQFENEHQIPPIREYLMKSIVTSRFRQQFYIDTIINKIFILTQFLFHLF